MRVNKKGLLVVISGPSGAGKDTVIQKIIEKNPKIKLSVSATTRSPREGEIDGENYFFMSKLEFRNMVLGEGVLEYAEYCGNYYGTPKKIVNEWINEGFDVILEIEVQGGAQIKDSYKDSMGIFILPPSMKELDQRLRKRNTESKTILERRLIIAKEEIKLASDYDYNVINDNIDECADVICDIIKSEKFRSNRMNNIIEEVLINE